MKIMIENHDENDETPKIKICTIKTHRFDTCFINYAFVLVLRVLINELLRFVAFFNRKIFDKKLS